MLGVVELQYSAAGEGGRARSSADRAPAHHLHEAAADERAARHAAREYEVDAAAPHDRSARRAEHVIQAAAVDRRCVRQAAPLDVVGAAAVNDRPLAEAEEKLRAAAIDDRAGDR